MKRLILTTVVVLLMVSPALAYQEGPGTNWWYVDASYVNYHVSGPLVIELDGNPAAGQTFFVGDTITITGDIHSYAGMCAYYNEAYTEWLLNVAGPSGNDSDTDSDYVYSGVDCAEVETITTASITYPLTTAGVHTVYMYSDAQVAYDVYDVAEDFVDALLTFEVLEPSISVDVDIKPGSCPNPLNVNSKGVLPVAILGTEDFDVSTIDPVSIRLAGVAPIRSSYEDVATPVDKQDECDCTEDGPDGFIDFTIKFDTQEIVAALGEVSDGDEIVLDLEGVTTDGTPIEGSDCVWIKSKGKPE